MNIYASFLLYKQLKFDNCIFIHNYALSMHNYLADIKFKFPPLPSVSVVGARGYAGIELIKLLIEHPSVQLQYAFGTSIFNLADDLLDSRFSKVKCLNESEILTHKSDIIFLATPAEISLKLTPLLLKQGSVVIDLSGAFRLKKNDYLKWYGFKHPEPELLSKAHYGLQALATQNMATLIANPGCYATAISLALIPLLKFNLIDPKQIVIDAKSGTSGAGKKALENLLFTEVVGECLPYKVGRHQHLPEIQESIEAFTGVSIEPHFSTSLLGTSRGIIAGIYLNSLTEDLKKIEKAYEKMYQNYKLVRFSSKISQYASLKKVVGTPFTNISYELVGRKLYVFSCIDNLLKGAASQAIENLNSLLNLPLEYSLIPDFSFSHSLSPLNQNEAQL